MAYIQNHRRMRANRVRRSRGLGDDVSDALTAIFGGGTATTPDLTSIPVPTEQTTTSTTATSDPTPTAPAAPTSNWVTIGGICKPTNPVFLGQLKDLQRQVNRVLDKLGSPLVGIDGSVGPQTMAALSTISRSTSAGAYGLGAINLASCDAVCSQVATLTARASNLADFLGASSSVSSPAPAETPSYVGAGGQVVPQGPVDSATDMWNNMGTMGKLGVAGLAIGAVVFASGAKGKRKPSKLRRSYRAARRHRRSRR